MGGEAELSREAPPLEALPTNDANALWRRVRDYKIIQWGIAYFGGALALAHAQELVGHAFPRSRDALRTS